MCYRVKKEQQKKEKNTTVPLVVNISDTLVFQCTFKRDNMLHVPLIGHKDSRMGGCSCKNRKLEHKGKGRRKEDLGKDISRNKRNTRNQERFSSSLREGDERENVHKRFHRRSNSTSDVLERSISPNIIIHQNIIIKQKFSIDNDITTNKNSGQYPEAPDIEKSTSIIDFQNQCCIKEKINIGDVEHISKFSANITNTKRGNGKRNEGSTTNKNEENRETNKQGDITENILEKRHVTGSRNVGHREEIIPSQKEQEDANTTLSSLSIILNRACLVNSISNDHSFENIQSYSSFLSHLPAALAEAPNHHSEIKKNKPRKHKAVTKSYLSDIYHVEYLDDIFKYIRVLESTKVLKTDFLNRFNSDQTLRSKTVNWMLKAQGELNFCDSAFYIAVYILDRILNDVYVPKSLHGLLATSAIWIATKICDSKSVSSSQLLDTSEECYSVKQLLRMEANVLQLVNFQVYTFEPSICVIYYMNLLDLRQDKLTKLSTMYALDCLSLLPEFSSTPTSLVAAAVVGFVQNIFHKDCQLRVYGMFLKLFTEEEIERIKSLEILLYIQTKNMTDENYRFREAYRKYNLGDVMGISKYISDVI